MRNLLISGILITLTCVMSGCEKDSGAIINFNIIGKWQLKKAFSGWGETTEYPNGSGPIVEFTRNTYAVYDSGNLIREGSYLIVREKSSVTKKTENMILFGATIDTKDDFLRSILEIRDEDMTISLDGYDGGYSFYTRIK